MEMSTNLLKQMEEGMPSFSKGQRQIATYIMEHYEKAAYMTAARLGATVNVSESTVVRFATELGFEGYPEFQRAIQAIIRNRLTSFQRIEVTNQLIGDGNVVERILITDADKIRHTAEDIDHDAFDRAVEALLNAKKIYIMGVRSSAHLAGFLNMGMRRMFDNIKMIQSTAGSEVFEQMISIGEDDVLVAISFPRYSKRVVAAVEFAHNVGANVISLTDSPQSPIALHADQLLTAHTDMASFVDSLVAPLSIINAMIVAVSLRKQEELSVRLRQLEEIWDEYDVYDKNQG
jgi:DNA-binding MurR/RpiR family transcriptional regulator